MGLFRHLETDGHFHRDSWFGRLFHPGRVSLRESSPTDSLHVVIHDNHLAAHVDRVSPLGLQGEGPPRYSLRRAAAHNLTGMAHDLVSLLRGRQGDHRCELDCEWVWGPSGPSEREAQGPWRSAPTDGRDLLDPTAAAWSVQLEARVSRALDESRLRRALGVALGRRPSGHDPFDVVDCPDDASLDLARDDLQRRPAAIAEWPPLRARLAHHPGGDVLMLNLNHAATDGVAALEVLRAIARAYARDGDAAGAGAGERPDFLAVSDLPVRPASSPGSIWAGYYRALVERTRNLLARPAQLAPDRPHESRAYGFHLMRLSAEDTRQVIKADRPGTSRNVLLAGLHLAIGDWNLQHGSPGRRIGVLVPVNLRPREWRNEGAANFSVTARVSTSRRHRADPKAVLAAITDQTTRNKRTRTGIALLAALERSGMLPLWAKQSLVVLQPLTRNRLVDTAILANLGLVDEPPSFGADAGETRELWFSTPARGPRTLCVGAVTVSGRLCVTLRYPRRLLSADAARRFADCYLAQVRLVADSHW